MQNRGYKCHAVFNEYFIYAMKNNVKIKICDMTDIDNISKILFLEPDYIGFNFSPKSPRYVVGRIKPEMLSIIPKRVKRVGVFINSNESEIRQYASIFGLRSIQLHGNEAPELCKSLHDSGFEVFKTFIIENTHDFDHVWEYEDCADYYLFDVRRDEDRDDDPYFDWQLILRQPIRKQWFLAGGINPRTVVAASQTGAAGIDLNSRFESSLGIKDYNLIYESLKNIRGLK